MPLSSCFACGSHSPTGHIIHDAAQRPQQNRTSCVFAWFNALKPMRKSASAHEVRAAAQAAGLRLLYHDAAKRPQQNRTCCGFAWFNVLKPMRTSASAHEVRAAAQAAGLRLLYHENRGKRSSAFSRKIKRAAQNVPPAAVQEKPHALSCLLYTSDAAERRL